MVERTCALPGCSKPHRAKELCSTHYNQQKPSRHRKVQVPCSCCGEPCEKDAGRDRRYVKLYCSLLCRDIDRAGGLYVCDVPETHPSRSSRIPDTHISMLLREPTARWSRQTVRTLRCEWCGWEFETARGDRFYCGERCKLRHKRARRRGLEASASGCFTRAELLDLFIRFDRRCAYCERRLRIDEQPAPDHVVALCRGGSNSISNILPACSPCNSDKRELSLEEWAVDRARRGLPAVVTTWRPDDHRYTHLTITWVVTVSGEAA